MNALFKLSFLLKFWVDLCPNAFLLVQKLLATTTLAHHKNIGMIIYPSFSLKNLDHTFVHFQNELQGLNK